MASVYSSVRGIYFRPFLAAQVLTWKWVGMIDRDIIYGHLGGFREQVLTLFIINGPQCFFDLRIDFRIGVAPTV